MPMVEPKEKHGHDPQKSNAMTSPHSEYSKTGSKMHKWSPNVKGIRKWLKTEKNSSKTGEAKQTKNHTCTKRIRLNGSSDSLQLAPLFLLWMSRLKKSSLCDTPSFLLFLFFFFSRLFLHSPLLLSAFCPISPPKSSAFSPLSLPAVLGWIKKAEKKQQKKKNQWK